MLLGIEKDLGREAARPGSGYSSRVIDIDILFYGRQIIDTPSLQVPHPNMFGGPVRMRVREDDDLHEMPVTYQYAEDARGIGLADMAEAISEGRSHRANAEVAFHVLEIMEAYLTSDREGRHVEIQSRCERPQAMEPGLGPAIVPGL